MLNRQRIAAVDYELDVLDREIALLAAADLMGEVDRLLDERHEQMLKREALARGEIPNG